MTMFTETRPRERASLSGRTGDCILVAAEVVCDVRREAGARVDDGVNV